MFIDDYSNLSQSDTVCCNSAYIKVPVNAINTHLGEMFTSRVVSSHLRFHRRIDSPSRRNRSRCTNWPLLRQRFLSACGTRQRPVACSSVNLEVLINLLVIGGDPSGIGGPSDFLIPPSTLINPHSIYTAITGSELTHFQRTYVPIRHFRGYI